AVVPIYLANISPVEYKGGIGALHQLFISLGVLLGQIISFFCHNLPEIYGISIVLGIYAISFILTLFIKNLYFVQKDSATLWQLLAKKSARKSLYTLICFHVCQKFTGLNAFVFFSNEIFKTSSAPRFNTIILGLFSVISIIISISLVDKLGRKICLKVSLFITLISLALLSTGNLSTIFLFIFMFGFYSGLGPITWVIIGDIFPSLYQPAAATIGVSINWFLAFVVSYSYEYLSGIMECRVFLFYFFGTLLTGGYILSNYRETRGKAAEFQ
ncbi:Solute carrier family 2, facilitated glucose transporter member 2, partial [Dictyocoela muelleri]